MNRIKIIAIDTRIFTSKDDIVEIVAFYTEEKVGKDDVICIAESVVAITQGKILRYEEMKIYWLARLLNRFIGKEGSLSTIYGMQACINAAGKWRVLFAMIAGAIAKLFGQKGVFYKLAGIQASLIDDVTGTCPPFDKYIVYGPNHPEKEIKKIKEKVNCFGVCIADVNDLKRSLIVAATKKIKKNLLADILINNPFGNTNEKRPICIIKNFRQVMEGINVEN